MVIAEAFRSRINVNNGCQLCLRKHLLSSAIECLCTDGNSTSIIVCPLNKQRNHRITNCNNCISLYQLQQWPAPLQSSVQRYFARSIATSPTELTALSALRRNPKELVLTPRPPASTQTVTDVFNLHASLITLPQKRTLPRTRTPPQNFQNYAQVRRNTTDLAVAHNRHQSLTTPSILRPWVVLSQISPKLVLPPQTTAAVPSRWVGPIREPATALSAS